MQLISIAEHPEWTARAAAWFHLKWGIPEQAYLESMLECQKRACPVPQWFVLADGETPVAGLGVIENDFHSRRDLTPNVCAVYVETAYRGRGLAGRLLRHACETLGAAGIGTLYLLTDHTSLYERCGWQFCCMVRGDGEDEPSRMYVHRM